MVNQPAILLVMQNHEEYVIQLISVNTILTELVRPGCKVCFRFGLNHSLDVTLCCTIIAGWLTICYFAQQCTAVASATAGSNFSYPRKASQLAEQSLEYVQIR